MPYVVATTKVTSARNVPYNGYAHSFAGMTTQFILLAGIDAGPPSELHSPIGRERCGYSFARAARFDRAAIGHVAKTHFRMGRWNQQFEVGSSLAS